MEQRLPPFAERVAAAVGCHGPLVAGLDPSAEVLRDWKLPDDASGLERFAEIVLGAFAGAVAVVKPQSAFYERHGWQGVRVLQQLVAAFRARGTIVLLDVKRGDVGSTNLAYADAYLAPAAPCRADAITVHPYLGLQALGPLVDAAVGASGGLFVVVRSSNSEGRLLQRARRDDGASVEAGLLAEIGALNERLAGSGVGPIGAVVGATQAEEPALDLQAARGWLLAPGLGAQGATPGDLARSFRACPERVLPAASRSLLAAGPDASGLREALRQANGALVAALGIRSPRAPA